MIIAGRPQRDRARPSADERATSRRAGRARTSRRWRRHRCRAPPRQAAETANAGPHPGRPGAMSSGPADGQPRRRDPVTSGRVPAGWTAPATANTPRSGPRRPPRERGWAVPVVYQCGHGSVSMMPSPAPCGDDRAATAHAATDASPPPCVPVALPRPSQGSRIASVTRVNGSTSATCLQRRRPSRAGGGPPAPSRNDGKNSSSPTAWADRADGSSEPSSTPRLMKADRAEQRTPTTTRPGCAHGGHAVDRRGDREQQAPPPPRSSPGP